MNKNERPIISIISASFNAKSALEDTIKSIQQQSYAYKEHIIIDGGSTDDTLELLRSLSAHSPPPIPVSPLVNTGTYPGPSMCILLRIPIYVILTKALRDPHKIKMLKI